MSDGGSNGSRGGGTYARWRANHAAGGRGNTLDSGRGDGNIGFSGSGTSGSGGRGDCEGWGGENTREGFSGGSEGAHFAARVRSAVASGRDDEARVNSQKSRKSQPL